MSSTNCTAIKTDTRAELHPLGLRILANVLALLISACGSERLTVGPEPHPKPVHPLPRVPASRSSESDAFDPDVVVVDATSPVAKARSLLAGQNPERALAAAKEGLARIGQQPPQNSLALAASADPAVEGRLCWLAAQAAQRLGQSSEAIAYLSKLAESKHPLSKWALLESANQLIEHDPAEAAKRARGLKTAWAGAERAQEIEVRALMAAGDLESALSGLRSLIEKRPRLSLHKMLADALAQGNSRADRLEALALYRRIGSEAVGTVLGQRADDSAKKLREELPEALHDPENALDLDWTRAQGLYDRGRYGEAEEAFRALLPKLRRDRDRRCEAELFIGKALSRRRMRDQAATHLERVSRICPEPVQPWARYHAARAHSSRGRYPQAIRLYRRIERDTPDHRLADDAMLRAALAQAEIEGPRRLARTLRRLPAKYPEGDMRDRARFIVAWRARAEGRFGEALQLFEAMAAQGWDDHAEDIRGRVAYWRARTLLDLKREEEGLDALENVIRSHPLSYYAQQAFARLDELAAERGKRLKTWLASGAPAETLTFEKRPEFETEAFARLLELLRVGCTDLATLEMRDLGLIDRTADKEELLLAAALYDRSGAHPEASLLIRRRLPSFMQEPPHGPQRHMWLLAYPPAFGTIIEEAADANEVPAAFVRAVAREESAFDPRAVSVANAVGLIQLIAPTARRYAKELGLPSDRESLMDPATNIAIGTRYIARLWERYDNHALVPSAYNAGEAAVDRWLSEREPIDLDVWIEEIPYDETQRYTRRVLQTYGIYNWLASEELPQLKKEVVTRPLVANEEASRGR